MNEKTVKPNYIVGVGSSAGGLDALQELLQLLPEHLFGASIIIAQHLSPQHKSILTELLAKKAPVPVVEVKDGMTVKAGHVYVTPSSYDIIYKDGCVHLPEPEDSVGPKPSADRLFTSLAEALDEHAIGIVLSGTGTDGTQGIKAIRTHGGITIAQCPDSAKYDGMPQSAINSNCIDVTLETTEMADFLRKVVDTGREKHVEKTEFRTDLDTVLNIVNEDTNLSFHGYKNSTLQRRLERRMVANGINKLGDYIDHLKTNKDEPALLAQDFLISVTHFFRDANAFGALKHSLRDLIKNKQQNEPIRIWSVGCATGEEPYSIAMLCCDILGGVHHLKSRNVQIFGTDIDTNALTFARKGTYPSSALTNIKQEYVEQYFLCHGDYCDIAPRIKDHILFSQHNVLEDPPFSNIDLVVCRNLLIYFNESLQQKVFKIFHYATKNNGTLFLGRSESVGDSERYFKKTDNAHNIFTKKKNSLNAPHRLFKSDAYKKSNIKKNKKPQIGTLSFDDKLLRSFVQGLAPNSVLVDSHMDIIHIYGDVSQFLKMGSGSPSTNLQDMIVPVFKQELRAFVYKVIRENVNMTTASKRFEANNIMLQVYIDIYPIWQENNDNALALIVFNAEEAKTPDDAHSNDKDIDAQRFTEISQELEATQEHLQTVIEELETSNEELQSLNEELQSANEELHSSNEELETSNEELQSTNEELTTVNDELNQKKGELEKLTNQLIGIKNAVNFPLLLLDKDITILRANKSAVDEFKLPKADNISFARYMPEFSEPERVVSLIRTVLDTEEHAEIRTQCNGSYYWIQCNPYSGGSDGATGVVVTYIDETERIESEAQLYDSMERYNALSNATDIPIYIKDVGGRYLAANKALQKLLDRDEEHILGKTDTELFGKGMGDMFMKNDTLVRESRKCLSFEESYSDEKNDKYTYLSIKSPLVDKRNNVYATSGISIDITERRKHLEQLALYKSVIDNANDIVIFTKADKISGTGPEITYVNHAFTKTTGYSPQEAIGNTPRMLQGEKTDKTTLKELKQALRNNQPYKCEIVNYNKSGDNYMLEINMFPVKDLNGEVKYYAAIERDITERYEYERALEATNEKIIRASQAKSDFLANMSHEIRTPMNAICGIADLLNNFNVNEEKQKDFHKKLGTTAGQLKELIDDILDFSKLEANQLEVEKEPFELADLIHQVKDIQLIRAQEKGLEFKVNIDNALHESVIGDKLRIKQILLNLVSNAIKFTDFGNVEINVKQHDTSDHLLFEVKDTGVGISKEQQKKVFSKFSQGGIGLDKKIGGTGLGLSISKKLAEIMGGTIELSSQEGQGACFSLIIPLPNAKHYKNIPVIESKLGKNDVILSKPVLIVEDTQTNVDVLTSYFDYANIAYDVAYSGKSAIDKVRQREYSVILMDLQMDGMDGFSTINHIRNLPVSYAESVPIIVVTAHAEESIRKRCHKAGIPDFITKPVDNQLLLRTLKKYESSTD